MAHRDHIAAPDEQMGFAEDDLLAHHMGRTRHHEDGVPVDFQLRALMGMAGIFDRQFMQAELRLNLAQQRLIRLMQADPDDGLVASFPGMRVLDLDIEDALAMLVDGGPR